MIDIIVISISTPIKIGIYENQVLIKEIEEEGKTSDILPLIFEKLLQEYDIKSITYVNTPGSYMAIKVAYVFLKTVCISRNIELNAASGFLFNDNSPIKALGKKYFFNKNSEIIIDFFLEATHYINFFKNF